MVAFLPQRPSFSFLINGLSERQRQCVTLVGQGMTSKQIARELGISPSTVDNHIHAVVDRLGAINRIEAARMVVLADSERKRAVENGDEPADFQIPNQEYFRQPSTAFRLWRLPPLGGSRNTIGVTARFLHVAQIALLGTMVFAAITATIAGIVNLFH